MSALNSVEALRMFAVFADALAAKPDRKSVTERVMDMVDSLHTAGFAIVPNRDEFLGE